jgi:capsid protein
MNFNLPAIFRARRDFSKDMQASSALARPERRTVKARYDAAKLSSENAEHWAMADGLDAASANSLAVRRVIRERARYECENNTYLGGSVDSMARDVVGRGPRVLFDGEFMTRVAPGSGGKTYGELAERDWEDWSANILLGEKLETAVRAWLTDGEAWAMPFMRRRFTGNISLDIRLYETDQVSTPWGKKCEVDGVVLDDATGEVKSYWLLDVHPGAAPEGGMWNRVTSFIGKYTGREIPADRLWQLYTPKRAGQLRGVSEVNSALTLCPLHRRYTLATVKAAETAASLSFVLETDTPDEGAAVIPLMSEMQIKANSGISTPEGWKAKQFKPEQPTSTFTEFSRELIQASVRCISVPLSIALGNSSGYNYASGRLDHQGYYRAIDVRRDRLENRIVDPTVGLFLREFLLTQGMSPDAADAITWEYTWDGMAHVDPVKDAAADDINIKNNTDTMADVCARRGKNWRRVIAQRGKEKKAMETAGLTFNETAAPAPASPNDQPTPDDDGSEPGNKQK